MFGITLTNGFLAWKQFLAEENDNTHQQTFARMAAEALVCNPFAASENVSPTSGPLPQKHILELYPGNRHLACVVCSKKSVTTAAHVACTCQSAVSSPVAGALSYTRMALQL